MSDPCHAVRGGGWYEFAEQGIELAGGFDAPMRRVRAKGWVFRTNGKWHFSDAAIHHMR